MKWISIDWDYVTDDCRGPLANTEYCPCWDNKTEHNKHRGKAHLRAPHVLMEHYDDILKLMQRVRLGKVVVRDCHGDIMHYIKPRDTVFHIDYHLDEEPYDVDKHGKPLRPPKCYNWIHHAKERDITIEPVSEMLHAVPDGKYNLFLCLSSPYTNSDYDALLFRLLMSLPVPVTLYGKVEPSGR